MVIITGAQWKQFFYIYKGKIKNATCIMWCFDQRSRAYKYKQGPFEKTPIFQ